MPDALHEDLHPSCKVYDTVLWHCFSCDAHGDIFTIAAEIYGIEARGPDWSRLRDTIIEALERAPVHGGGGDV